MQSCLQSYTSSDKKGFFLNPLAALVFICISLVSCRHDVDISALPEVKFSTSVQGIISSNCTFSGCHGDSGGQQGSEFSLVGYDNVIENGDVKAGDARDSKLYKVISGHGEKMPPDPYPPLSDDQIKRIFIWIEQGAKNN